jgi:hypothetical protein
MQNYEETLRKLKAAAFDEIEKAVNEEKNAENIGIRASRIVNLTMSLQAQIKK